MPTLTEEQVIEQLEHQHDQYTSGATGTAVQADQDARMALDDTTRDDLDNETWVDDINSTDVTNYNGTVNAKVYAGGNTVQPVNATYMENLVQEAIAAGELFATGGPYTSDYSLASPYVDPLVLIEGSKLMGDKAF